MENTYFAIVTDLGARKMLEAVNEGKKVNITHFAVGDGGGGYYTPSVEMTQLKNEVWRGAVNSCRISEESENLLIIESVIPSGIGGFTIREMGVFNEDDELIAICNTPDTQKVRVSDGVVHELSLSIEIALSNTDSVQLLVDPNVVMATKKDLQELQSEVKNTVDDLQGKVEGITNLKNIEDAFYGVTESNNNEQWEKVWSLVRMLVGNVDITNKGNLQDQIGDVDLENKGSLQEQIDSIFDSQDSISVIDDTKKLITTTYADGTSTVIVMDDTSMIETVYDAEGGKVSRTGIYMDENRIEIRGLGLDEK